MAESTASAPVDTSTATATPAPVPASPTGPAAAAADALAPSTLAALAAGTATVDPRLDPAWQQYVSQCAQMGVRDLSGLCMDSVRPYLTLNQYHRDQLSRTVPLAPLRLYRAAIELMEKDQCPSCWLTSSCCMCANLRGLVMRHKVFMMMHHKEFGRGSNTGKLAVRTGGAIDASRGDGSGSGGVDDITASSAIIQPDIALQERALLDLCERHPLNTVVLFPSKDSISIEEFVAQRGWSLPPPRSEYLATKQAPHTQAQGADANADADAASSPATSAPAGSASASASPSSSLPPCPPLNIILLDGTWRQARGMRHLLPTHIPSIRIDPFKYRLDGTLKPARSIDVKAAAEMAAADGQSADLIVDVNAAASAPAAEVAPVQPLSGDQASPSPSSSPAAGSSTSTGSAKAGTKPKLSQRDAVHREGKKAPKASSGDAASGAAAVPTFVSLFYPLRKQSQPDRISTVEALVILLMELHEPPTVTHALLDLLRVLVDSMRVQCGMNGVYGTYDEEQGKQMRNKITMACAKRTAAAKAATAAAAALGSDGATSADGSSSSSVAPIVHKSRKQRSRRSNALKPCMPWNRSIGSVVAPCPSTPCRYAHCCMLCNDPTHRAAECSLAHAEQSLADALRNAALGAGAASPDASSAPAPTSD